ncbi:MAG: TetR/AcrR family transcriptional regulator [Desulfitobacteriaceae bacterium]
MSERRYVGEQTKAYILDKARTLFSDKGYTATSMDDICNATGRSISNIYYYFKSKEDLFLNLAEQTFVETQHNTEMLFSKYKTITEKLYAYGDFIASIERLPLSSLEREFLSKVGIDSETGKRFLTLLTPVFDEFKKHISEGIDKGELKAENLYELSFIVSSYYGGLSRSTSFMDKETKKTLFRKGTTLLLQGITTRNEI